MAHPFTLPELPYSKDALAPYISADTLTFHHEKHHQAYVNKLNNFIEGTDYSGQSLEEIIKNTYQKEIGIFNNAAQVWNHTFYWHSMKKNGGGTPTGELAEQIDKDFGSFEIFTKEFQSAGAAQFGSGWAWLVWDYADRKLKVTKTANAELPMLSNQCALLTADVWEHAYYLDYQNRRPDYLKVFLENLVNWDFVAKNFEKK